MLNRLIVKGSKLSLNSGSSRIVSSTSSASAVLVNNIKQQQQQQQNGSRSYSSSTFSKSTEENQNNLNRFNELKEQMKQQYSSSSAGSVEDQLDIQNSVEIKGLPSNVTKNDIQDIFKGLSIASNGIKMIFDDEENIGFALVTFDSAADKLKALEIKKPCLKSSEQSDITIVPLSFSKTDWKTISKSSYMNRTAVTNHLWRSRTPIFNIKSKQAPSSTVTRPIVDKPPQDSYTEIYLHFSSDTTLREMYLSPYGNLRVGRFLEDLDALAGTVAYKHAEDTTEEKVFTIVTASVDRIHLLRPLVPDRDFKMEGIVTWVGKSSMEIVIKARSKNNETGEWEGVLVAYFTMVARDPLTKRAASVNRLVPTNEKEQKLFNDGISHKTSRLDFAKLSLQNVPPNSDELQIIHDLFMRSKDDKSNFHWIPMKDTSLQTVILCQPQERNMHGNIFGGYLMRKGFEIAFTTAFLQFNESIPTFFGMDDITFVLPVDIGNILTLDATVVYTESVDRLTYVQVEVVAHVSNPVSGSSEKHLSNVFNFTFLCRNNKDADTVKPKRILPQSYSEAMRYLAGKRIVDKQKLYSHDDMEIWQN
ncbi:RNA-binding region RNP-1 domain-containing protein [Heterostelium album PN500]|uniref:RNA-binding region RNP-1 domain-containing protein n=1 Tax=Heterostelium pallidum (strain ATCC 26659 / Pp 5 / PN500) TaxID=670386 RepID=D3BKT0_HETP5|nr:RNA-binding region RNP-1 domain-containing protein [Heterostelium album PN500]EFA78510.1 RNA-binding region RNP-1 domain-containing protein [Heterostelium album PN500]|eukprot:XP_020430634.1 RNA-binding region RNP-1 domain-containing protein [Heterostelium album PN500]